MAMKKRILGIMLVFMMGILGVQSLAAEKIKIGFLLKTMQEERYQKVFVAGSDADLINIRYILQGKQSVDVFKKIKPLAEMAAEAAVKLAKNPNKKVTDVIKFDKKVNDKFTDVPVIVTPIVLVTKSNIDATVIKDGFHKKEDVYKK